MDVFTQFDGELLITIQSALCADWLTPVMKFITMFGEAGNFWIFICLVMLLFKRTRRLGIICSFSLLATFIVCNLCLKPAVDRVRPWVMFEAVNRMLPDPGDASFPSGHSANSMAVAWAMFIATLPVKITGEDGSSPGRSYDALPCLGWDDRGVSPRIMHWLSAALVVLAVLIGVSRLYLGMHYPSDVVCGLLLGMLTTQLTYKAILSEEAKHGIIGGKGHRDPDVIT